MKLLTTAALVASLCIISAPPVLAENIVGSVRTWKSMQADGWKSADGYDDNHMHNALYQAVARDWLRLQLAGQEREVFMVLYLDNQHRLLESETLFAGSVNHVQVHPREVVKSALRFNAAAVVLAHNHPSGDPEPSQCDRNITGRLKEALALVDVNTLDHLVIGSDGIVSFAERGWI